jgi:hypothetical protein
VWGKIRPQLAGILDEKALHRLGKLLELEENGTR